MILLNDKEASDKIIELLKKYVEMLELDSEFIKDLLKLLSSSGVERRVLTRLEKYLGQLQSMGEKAIGKKGDPIEHLSGQRDLSSMRFPLNATNLRILFSYQEGKVYLLCAFYERKGHRNTEYGAYIPVALKRLNELKGE